MRDKPYKSQQLKQLEKGIRSNCFDEKQRNINVYVTEQFNLTLNKILTSSDSSEIMRLTGALTAYKNMINILSNAELSILNGDKND